MRRMRYIIFVIAAVISAAGCGKEQDRNTVQEDGIIWDNVQNDNDMENENGGGQPDEEDSQDEVSKSVNPTFTGDTLELFGLEEMEAFDLLGKGSILSASGYTIRNENGIEVYLSNSIDEVNVYTVQQVVIDADTDVSFHGIKVGDSLKDTDKILMDEDAIYAGGLKWSIKIEGYEYQICFTTLDDQTIASIEASRIQNYGVEKEFDLSDNPFSYEEDLHDLEPQYWE